MSPVTKQKQTHRHRKQYRRLSKGKRWEGMNRGDLGLADHRLLYTQCTRPCCIAQGACFSVSVVTNHNGKERNGGINTPCVTESFAADQKLTHLLKQL